MTPNDHDRTPTPDASGSVRASDKLESNSAPEATDQAGTSPQTREPNSKPQRRTLHRRVTNRPPRPKGATRKLVFASVWLLIGVVATAALVKLAFFSQPESFAEEPTGQLKSPTVTVTRSSVSNKFTVTGSVTADDGVSVRATDQGTVTTTFVKVGDQIEQGAPMFEVREEIGQTDPTPIGTPNPQTGEQQFTTPEPVYAYHEIYAPASGQVTSFTPLPKMQISIGEEVGEIGPGTFTVVANLTADLQYRMLDHPASATVTISGGPAPFDCSSLAVGTPPKDDEQAAPQPAPVDPYADPYGNGGMNNATTQSATGQIRCAVPTGEAVFAGLSADVTVVAGSVDNALTVPVTAVRGEYATGLVYRVAADGGDPQEISVQLGLTDGTVVEITSGLNEGDVVLEYVPSKVPVYNDEMAFTEMSGGSQ